MSPLKREPRAAEDDVKYEAITRKRIQTSSLLCLLFGLTNLLVAEASLCPGNVPKFQYQPLDHLQIAVPVRINSSGPYEFLVDTGSQLTIVEPSLAAELGLKPVATGGVISVTRYADVPMALADRIEAGSVFVERPVVAIEDLGQLKELYPKIRGKLGESFLEHFDVLLDYAHKALCLDDSGTMREEMQGERVPLVAQETQQGRLAVAHPILIGARLSSSSSRETILRLDSGTNVALLYKARLEAPLWKQMENAKQCAVTHRSSVSLTVVPPQDVRIGGRLVRGVAFMTPVRTGKIVTIAGEDGLLPSALFKRVFISHAKQFVIFDPL